jgi:putative NADPH-quinone reductase
MDLVIYAHPDNATCHNAMVLKLVENTLKASGREYRLIDLYKQGFDPRLTDEEYKRTVDKTHAILKPDPKIAEYQQAIREADRLVFVYPTWWYGPPAILKGFFDRVFVSGFAYNFLPTPWYIKYGGPLAKYFLGSTITYKVGAFFMPVKQHLKGKSAVVINTYGGEDYANRYYNQAPRNAVDRIVLEMCGISTKRVNWFKCERLSQIPESVKTQIIDCLK